MERKNEYHGNRNHANSSSGAVWPLNIAPATSSRTPPPPPPLAMSGVDGGPPTAGGPAAREQDQYMPIANVIRIMRRILPAHAKISDDAKETIQECVSEYISFVTGEANDRCRREQRKTVTAEDVLWAMAKLGFDDYVPPLTLFLNRHRASTTTNVTGSDGGDSGPKRTTFAGPAPPIVDPYGRFGPVPVPTFVGMGGHFRQPHPYPHHHVMFDPMTVYYPGGSGGPGSSSAGQIGGGAGFGPFVQFK